MITFEWKPKQSTKPVLDEAGKPVMDGEVMKTEVATSPFKGSVLVRPLKHSERLEISREYRAKVSDSEIENNENALDLSERLMELAIKQIEKVNLFRIDDDVEFSSVEMLEYDPDGMEVLISIGQDLISGVRLGKNSLRT